MTAIVVVVTIVVVTVVAVTVPAVIIVMVSILAVPPSLRNTCRFVNTQTDFYFLFGEWGCYTFTNADISRIQ